MNKNKKNRKGFTIVELVIVIAVIGILATVLVPTFGDVISDAKETKLLQEAKSLYTNYVSAAAKTGEYVDDCWVAVSDSKYVEIENGAVKGASTATAPAAHFNLLKDGKLTAAVKCAADKNCDICK